MIVLIDNRDSFVHNLARYFAELGCATTVLRDDRTSLAEIAAAEPAAIVVSPGPCSPAETIVSVPAIREFSDRVPILGVCLGHQAIASAFGGEVVRAPEPVHGRTSPVQHDGSPLFDGMPSPFEATRYHSLVVQSLPDRLRVTAWTADGLPMAVQHESRPTFGVQFHPESVLTVHGPRLLENFLAVAGLRATGRCGADVIDVTPTEPDEETLPAGMGPLHW